MQGGSRSAGHVRVAGAKLCSQHMHMLLLGSSMTLRSMARAQDPADVLICFALGV